MLSTVIEQIGVLVAVGYAKCFRCGKPYALDGTMQDNHMCHKCNLAIARKKWGRE